MNETVDQITQLSTNTAMRSAGYLPAGPKPESTTNTQWRLKGLLISTGTWVNIDSYPNEMLAKDAFVLLRARVKFSDTVNVRDPDAFAVFSIESVTNVQFLGGVLHG